MRLGSETLLPTQSAMPQERKERVSLRSNTWTCQLGCWARMDWVAKVPAWVHPTTATTFWSHAVRADEAAASASGLGAAPGPKAGLGVGRSARMWSVWSNMMGSLLLDGCVLLLVPPPGDGATSATMPRARRPRPDSRAAVPLAVFGANYVIKSIAIMEEGHGERVRKEREERHDRRVAGHAARSGDHTPFSAIQRMGSVGVGPCGRLPEGLT